MLKFVVYIFFQWKQRFLLYVMSAYVMSFFGGILFLIVIYIFIHIHKLFILTTHYIS